MTTTAKIFVNGRSQAVRLPAAYRFDTKEVFIRQDPETGDVILSRKPPNWDSFFTTLKAASLAAEVPTDFLDENEQNQAANRADPFEGWRE
jgi:antitoxin VapB